MMMMMEAASLLCAGAVKKWWQQRSKSLVISNSFYSFVSPILASKPDLIKIGSKIQKLKIFAIRRLWAVSWVSQKIAVAISNLSYVFLCPMLPPKTNFT